MLNINGPIQSGNADRTLTLLDNSPVSGGGTLAEKIAALETAGKSEWITLTDSDIEVFYNHTTNRIIIDNVTVDGGLIKLTGHILSTDTDGLLRVMDGFGKIIINNQSSWDMDVQSIKTGEDDELVLTGEYLRVTGADMLVTGRDWITLKDNGVNGADTITRQTGSFILDGFYKGQKILIKGSQGGNNGIYTIDNVEDKVITLSTGDTLTTEFRDNLSFEISGSWITLSDTGADDIISRSAGSWITDGFYVGQTIRIINSANANNGTYIIKSLSDQNLVIEGGNFNAEVSTSTTLEIVGNWITFSHTDDSDTITRNAGSWIEEGYRAGQTIVITNSGHNNGEYKIVQVTEKELELDSTAFLVNETNISSALEIRGKGNGIEGKVMITDTAYDVVSAPDVYKPLTTTYTRIGNSIQITNNDLENLYAGSSSIVMTAMPHTSLCPARDITG
jgi:hypothetical protein